MKEAVVVDTNVAMVADGRSEHASAECRWTCIERLERIMNDDEILLLDACTERYILNEYQDALYPSRQKGVGSVFLKWVQTNEWNSERCARISITPLDNTGTNFQEFPSDPALGKFHLRDRKFVAVAVAYQKTPPPQQASILNAVDTDWWVFREALQRYVKIEFICENDIQRLSQAQG